MLFVHFVGEIIKLGSGLVDLIKTMLIMSYHTVKGIKYEPSVNIAY